MVQNNKQYELKGYDRYDSTYYRIGVYDTYQEVVEAMKAEKAKQSNNCENDMLEINTIQ